METGDILSGDLSAFMEEFVRIREFYTEEQRIREQMSHTLLTLKDEVRFSQAAERTERSKLHESRTLLQQQQEALSRLLAVKDDNERLTVRIKELEKTVADLTLKLETDNSKWEEQLKDVERENSCLVDRIKQKCQEEVRAAKEQLEATQQELLNFRHETTKKLEEFENNKIEELNLTVQIYEEKLLKLEKESADFRTENQRLVERASANISIYKKKLMEMERSSTVSEPSSMLVTATEKHIPYHQPSNYGRTLKLCEVHHENQTPDASLQSKPSNLLTVASIKKKVTFPAVKKRKLFTNHDNGKLL